jgi:hypothetical protein
MLKMIGAFALYILIQLNNLGVLFLENGRVVSHSHIIITHLL